MADHGPLMSGAGDQPPSGWTLPDLRVDRDGEWYDSGVQVTHPGVLANLRGNLRRDAAGYFIQTRVRIPVVVDDVPWVVTRVEPRGDRLHLLLSDDSKEDIDPGTLWISAQDVPYCPVKGGTFEARFSRAATFQLLALVDHDEAVDGGGVLRVGGREFRLRHAGA
jgi:hypothetical protein